MIESLIDARDYVGLLEACEDYEIQLSTGTGSDTSLPLSTIYTAFLASYIITNDLQSTRFLRKRMLATASSQGWTISDETNRMWAVCAALLKSDYASAYTTLNDTTNWRPELQQMVQDILASLRERMIVKLSQLYETLSLDDTTTYFGMDETKLVAALTAEGWTYDTSTRLFTTKQPDATPRVQSSFQQLSGIANIVLHLDKF
ncbi:COP9 signalosome [Gongronella butleri]|nr:COP9 signalosome [Gongronella butleri]